jgi:hypothetical protein
MNGNSPDGEFGTLPIAYRRRTSVRWPVGWPELALMRSGSDTSQHGKHAEREAHDHQDARDHTANLSRLRLTSATGVHRPGVHFLQIVRAHDPGDDAARSANNQTQNSKNEYESATMRFHMV